jgi:hypothetical protein
MQDERNSTSGGGGSFDLDTCNTQGDLALLASESLQRWVYPIPTARLCYGLNRHVLLLEQVPTLESPRGITQRLFKIHCRPVRRLAAQEVSSATAHI